MPKAIAASQIANALAQSAYAPATPENLTTAEPPRHPTLSDAGRLVNELLTRVYRKQHFLNLKGKNALRIVFARRRQPRFFRTR
jgi:hypothetical protein